MIVSAVDMCTRFLVMREAPRKMPRELPFCPAGRLLRCRGIVCMLFCRIGCCLCRGRCFCRCVIGLIDYCFAVAHVNIPPFCKIWNLVINASMCQPPELGCQMGFPLISTS